jgi:hypothetical protein
MGIGIVQDPGVQELVQQVKKVLFCLLTSQDIRTIYIISKGEEDGKL